MTANDPFVRIPPPRPGCRATVVIPARNEAERIARTLGALAAQRDVDGGPLPRDVFDVLVYANNCDDATAEVARAAAGMHAAPAIHVAEEHLPANVAHIGTARRTAMEAAAARLRNANVPDAILAATDADTVPAPGWIAWTLREMERADAVTGRILIDPVEWAALPAHTRRMLLEENAYLYAVAQLEAQLDPKPYDPWPRHWQRSGPSFAVRVDAYEAAGGVPPVRALEDIALYEALERNGARIVTACGCASGRRLACARALPAASERAFAAGAWCTMPARRSWWRIRPSPSRACAAPTCARGTSGRGSRLRRQPRRYVR